MGTCIGAIILLIGGFYIGDDIVKDKANNIRKEIIKDYEKSLKESNKMLESDMETIKSLNKEVNDFLAISESLKNLCEEKDELLKISNSLLSEEQQKQFEELKLKKLAQDLLG